MDRYMLSREGRARFQREKISVDIEEKVKMKGYDVLDYLYEHGAATVEEIEEHTGLSWGQVVDILGSFIPWGYIEGLAEQ